MALRTSFCMLFLFSSTTSSSFFSHLFFFRFRFEQPVHSTILVLAGQAHLGRDSGGPQRALADTVPLPGAGFTQTARLSRLVGARMCF